jgi:hypothetical protein
VNLVDELVAIAGALRDSGVDYAVCGGIAVTIHGATRTTKDIDLLVAPEDVDRAMEALRPLQYTFAALPMTFEDDTGRAQRVQRVTKLQDGAALVVDLLIAEHETAQYLRDAIEVTLPEATLRVVTRADLVRMKQAAGRPQDLADVQRLAEGDDGP